MPDTLSKLINSTKKSTTQNFDIDGTTYITSEDIFFNSGRMIFAPCIRGNNQERPPAIFVRIQYGNKINGSQPHNDELSAFELDIEKCIELLSFLQSDSQEYTYKHKGFKASNHTSLSLSRDGSGYNCSIQSSKMKSKFLLSQGNIFTVKAVLMSAIQTKYYYLSDSLILGMIPNHNQGLAVNPSSQARDEKKSQPKVEPQEFDKIKLAECKSEDDFIRWVKKIGSFGPAITHEQQKALWAIGNQKFNGDPRILKNINIIQLHCSKQMASIMIDNFNIGIDHWLVSAINWNK